MSTCRPELIKIIYGDNAVNQRNHRYLTDVQRNCAMASGHRINKVLASRTYPTQQLTRSHRSRYDPILPSIESTALIYWAGTK